MSCQLFSALVDKQPVAIRRLGFFSIFIDIVFNQDTCLRHKRNLTKAVSLSQYDKGSLFWVEVVKVQCRDLCGSGPRVIEQNQKTVIPEPFLVFKS